MSQYNVLKWLQDKRQYTDEYYSVKEIENGLKENNIQNGWTKTIRGDLIKLERSGFLESKILGRWSNWNRLYRAKKNIVEGKSCQA